MLINAAPSFASYIYTGVNDFPVPYQFYGLTSILVQAYEDEVVTEESDIVDLIYDVDYTVTGVLSPRQDPENTDAFESGSITLTPSGIAKISNGWTVVVYRATEREQQNAYNELDNFPAASHENALGKLSVMIQEVDAGISRSVKVPLGSTEDPSFIAEQLLQARDQAVAAAEDAMTSETNAADSAAAAASNASSANQSAINAANSASSASTSATSAATDAASASTSAASAATDAASASTDAASAATDAASASTDADRAEAAYGSLQDEVERAETAATNAANSEDLAYKWANNPEDVPVQGSEYSAYHWAKKAEESGGGGTPVVVSDALDGTRTAADKVASSEWALNQAYTAGSNAQTAANAAQATADEALAKVPDKATSSSLGIVQPDNTTITIDENGIISTLSSATGSPLLSLMWSTIGLSESGYIDISQDNGLLLRSAYPEAWAKVQQAVTAGLTTVVSDSAWQAEKTANGGTCGKYSTGDGSTTFRVPLLRKVFIRAADPTSGLVPGMYQGDATRPIVAGWEPNIHANTTTSALLASPTGATVTRTLTKYAATTLSQGQALATVCGIDSSLSVPTAEENRPVTVAYTPMLKMYGAVTEAGEANIAQLIQQTNAKLDTSRYEADMAAMPFTKVWTSDQQTISAGLRIIVTHNLNLTPNSCIAIPEIVCVVETGGYAVGDVAQVLGVASTERWGIPFPARLYTDKVEVTIPAHATLPIVPMSKTTGAAITFTASQWALRFRIFYN